MVKNYVIQYKSITFVTVFHGIRFKVRRLFVVMTDNFFLPLPLKPLIHKHCISIYCTLTDARSSGDWHFLTACRTKCFHGVFQRRKFSTFINVVSFN